MIPMPWMFCMTERNFIYLGYSASVACIAIDTLLFSIFETKSFPQIQCSGSVTSLVELVNSDFYTTCVDGCEIATNIDMLQILFVSYYIFNICYPKRLV